MKSQFRVLLVFRCRSTATSAMLQGIAKYQRLHNPWSVYVDDDAGFECRSKHLWHQKWDGVICAYTTPSLVKTCQERSIPLVDLTDGPHFPGIPQVRPNNLAVGHMAAEDFIERGYQNFAYVGFANEIWSGERRAGFIESLALVGRSCDVLETQNLRRYTPDWDAAQIRQISSWLQQQPKPLALLAAHDELALQVLEAARIIRRSVPEDLVVLGVNNEQATCEMSRPLLSSVALDNCAAGCLAAERLARMMEAPADVPAITLVEPTAVITRQSTDILAISDRRISKALNYIRENACGKLSIREVVKRVGVARHDLERGFRRHIGRSPQAEIRRIRITEIKRLLQSTDRTLHDIAELTGFEHVEYMCVMFKRLVGQTPGSFRRDAQVGLATEPGSSTSLMEDGRQEAKGARSATAVFTLATPVRRKASLAAAVV